MHSAVANIKHLVRNGVSASFEHFATLRAYPRLMGEHGVMYSTARKEASIQRDSLA
jgi:hypothetical protein